MQPKLSSVRLYDTATTPNDAFNTSKDFGTPGERVYRRHRGCAVVSGRKLIEQNAADAKDPRLQKLTANSSIERRHAFEQILNASDVESFDTHGSKTQLAVTHNTDFARSTLSKDGVANGFSLGRSESHNSLVKCDEQWNELGTSGSGCV